MGKAIRCGEFGRDFLTDPESDFGRSLNPHVLTIGSLLDQPYLVFCGEPGMGKSTAVAMAKGKIVSQPGADQNPIWLSFREIPSAEIFHRKTFETKKWQEWLDSRSRLTLVIDGIDEGLMKVPDFVSYLAGELREAPVQRLQLILVCRTAEWSLSEGGQISPLWGKSEAENVFELCPLRQKDVRIAAQECGVDADNFISAIYEQQVAGLAARPCTLLFLLHEFKERGGFPGTHFDLYHEGCKRLCGEHDSRRIAASRFQQPQHTRPTQEDVQRMAARIAALLMLSGKSAVTLHSGDDADPTDLLLDQIAVTPSESGLVHAALSSALFSARGTDRFGFAHQTFAECLAANALQNVPMPQVKTLLCQCDGVVEHVVPQLAETAAWLAAMRNDFLEFLIAHEPEVLLRSDVARIQAKYKEQLVAALLERAMNEEAFDERDMRNFYGGLKHPGLAQQLWKYINDQTINSVPRRMAIEIAGACELAELMTEFLDLLRSESDGTLRDALAKSLESITPSTRAHELIPLAKGGVGPDEDDTIKGCAFRVLVPNVWSVGEAMQFIAPPQNESFFGAYRSLLQYHLPKHVQADDLPALLKKLLEWEDCFDSLCWFERLADKTIVEAVRYINDQAICDLVVAVWLQKSRQHLNFGGGSESEFKNFLSQNPQLRLRFAESILNSPATTIEDIYRLRLNEVNLVVASDLRWALERISTVDFSRREIWAEIIHQYANPDSTKACWDLFLGKLGAVPELRKRFNWIRTYSLKDSETRRIKAAWLRNERHSVRHKRHANLDPEILIREDLTQLQDGKSDWWLPLCRHLWRTVNGASSTGSSHDLTTSEGWKNSTEERKQQIKMAARCFLMKHDDGYAAMGGRTNFSDPGYMAIWLLRHEVPNDVELASVISAKWINGVIGYNNNDESEHQQIVALVYALAPEECVKIFIREALDEDKQLGRLFILRGFGLCWDLRLTETLVGLIKSGRLKPSSIESALSFLAEVATTTAVECAKSMLPRSIDFDHTPLELTAAILASSLGTMPNRIWDVAWPLIVNQPLLAEPVLSRIGSGIDYHCDRTFFPALTEYQLAETYLILERTFPQSEDPPHSDGEISPRRAIVRFKSGIIGALVSRNTQAACQQLLNLSVKLPGQRTWLRWRFNEALCLKRRKAWHPARPEFVKVLLSNPKARVINHEGDLLEVVLESIERFQTFLTTMMPPGAGQLWNYRGSGNKRTEFRPKDEEDLSDRIAGWLRDDIGASAGVVVGREVQPRRGQRTDVTVVAVGTPSTTQLSSNITVVVEVKGCWNPDVRTAIDTQLVQSYLEKNGLTHGIYLVGWYLCDRWDAPSKGAKSNLNSTSYDAACKEVAELAKPYDGVRNPTVVKAICLDCRFPQ